MNALARLRRRRRSARVVLLDPDGRVLLLRQADVEPAYWYLPGGGVLPFERLERAAARELREETGIRDAVLGPVVGEQADVSFVFRGRRVVQDEWYLAGFVATSRVGTGRRGDGERRAVDAHRWWRPEELAASGETAFPPRLPELVAAVAAWVAAR